MIHEHLIVDLVPYDVDQVELFAALDACQQMRPYYNMSYGWDLLIALTEWCAW
jgi:hypothetical protein